MLELRKVETSYSQSQVLFGLDLQINVGEVVTLLGRNGMGKTTTIHSIMGLARAQAGEIIFDGDQVRDWPPHRANHMGNQLSGGEQQMLAIGRALMTNPRLLILDEATEGLAPLIRTEIWDCLKELKSEGQSILVVDKNIEALTHFADRHYIIEKGLVVWTGDSPTLSADKEIQRRYLGV